tara:strand:+ start:53 stop:214 length:162 start_codon:yes stop_codon:yes gene_type:complete
MMESPDVWVDMVEAIPGGKQLMLTVVVVFSELDLVVVELQGVEETEEKVQMVV